MRLRLWLRLFLVFATLSVVALGSFVIWQQHSFRRGFRDYLDQVALDRLGNVSTVLATQYALHGDWEFLRRDPRQFNRLLDPDHGYADPRPPPPRADQPPPHDDRPPPDRAIPRDNDRPPPRDDPPPPPRNDRPPPHPPGPFDLASRTLLLDAAGKTVVGAPDISMQSLSVPVQLDGKKIGELHLAPLPQLLGDLDRTFAQAQMRDALIGGVMVLIAALLFALGLAYWLLKPIRSLAHATRALATGDYGQRVVISRRDEFGDLASDFNHLASALEQNREARRQWGADIAHELRTPLSILRGEIQALQDGIRQPNAAALASLQAEGERLTSLIEDLYQLALADAGALDYRFAAVDLAALIAETVELHTPGFADIGLTLESQLASTKTVRGDARRLAQLLDNLLANAQRYTDAPGRIRLTLVEIGEELQLSIDDTAPGVPPASLPLLFERLYRVDGSRNRAGGGAGLGLAICRAIVAAHDGQIEASASPLGGLRIGIRLPIETR